MAVETITDCPACGYPIKAQYEGQTTVCANCGEKLEVISQGITIPTTLFWSLIAFGAGVILGPALISSTAGGRKWLEEKARIR